MSGSLLIGPVQVSAASGCSALDLVAVDLQRLRQHVRAVDQVPGAVALGSWTLSVASPALLVMVAEVSVAYSLATPGVNAPNEAGRR